MDIGKKNIDYKRANDSQLHTFLSGYDDQWRLSKLVFIKMLLEEREKLKRKLRSFYGPTFKKDEDDYIYNEATNGLILSAISELVMYIEDYFVLLRYIREDEEFIKRVVKYWAGTIGKVPNRVSKLSDVELIKAHMIPSRGYILETINEQNQENKESSIGIYDKGVKNVLEYINVAIETFNKYRFFYNQYKHGLTIALRPFGGKLSKAELFKRKDSLYGFPVSYDNESIENALKKNKLDAVIIPSLTPDIQPGLVKLQEEENLLRYHYGDLTNINDLINIGKKVHLLIRILIKNRFDYVIPSNKDGNTFYLPYPKKRDDFCLAQFTVVPSKKKLSLDYFKVKI